MEHKSKFDALKEEKNKIEQELTIVKNRYEDKIAHLQLQVEELQLDKEIAEEHVKQLQEQLDEIMLKESELEKHDLGLEYLDVETHYKQKIQELITKNTDYSNVGNAFQLLA